MGVDGQDGPDETEEKPTHITVTLQNSGGERTEFKCKRTTKFSKILSSYAKQKGQDEGTLKLFFDGERIKGADTPESLDLQEEDIVEVQIEQIGGGEDDDEEPAPDVKPGQISIFLQNHTGEQTQFKIKRSLKMRKVFDSYAQRIGVDASSLKFTSDGTNVIDTDTPESLELEEQDIIQVHAAQTGGARLVV